MSPPGDPLEALRPYLANRLPSVAAPYVAGVVGDHPSTYSRSPAMWNAAFAALALPAVYVPFDVAPEHLEAFLAACRTLPALLGLNVTVPYKERAAAFLDTLDSDAAAAGAVNTILRTPEAELAGANTDGLAAHQVLARDLEVGQRVGGGLRLLLLGAGGAARAVGVAAAARIPHGEILISARRAQRAASCAEAIRRAGGRAVVIEPDALPGTLAEAAVVVNTTPVGMAGPLRTDGGITWLEPFSALAAADPPVVAPEGPSGVSGPAADGSRGPAPSREWWGRAWPAIATNLEESLRRALRLRSDARVLDLIYAPVETVTLKHARWTGHRVANGQRVLLLQAVEAFLLLCRPLLRERPGEAVRSIVAGAMAEAWTGGATQ